MDADRANAIRAWQQQHPEITEKLRNSLTDLDDLYAALLGNLCDSAGEASGEWGVNEFLDTYGPKLAYMQNILKTVHEMSIT